MFHSTLTAAEAQHLVRQHLAYHVGSRLRTASAIYDFNPATGTYSLTRPLQDLPPADAFPAASAIDRQTRLIVATVLFVGLGAFAFVTMPFWVPAAALLLFAAHGAAGPMGALVVFVASLLIIGGLFQGMVAVLMRVFGR